MKCRTPPICPNFNYDIPDAFLVSARSESPDIPDFSWKLRLYLDLKERISNRMQLREEQKAERQRKQLVNILTLFKCQTIHDATYK